MERNNKKIKELRAGVVRLAGYLDERWKIVKNDPMTYKGANFVYYDGILKTVEMLGGDWQRDENGKHKVFIAGVGGKAVNNDED